MSSEAPTDFAALASETAKPNWDFDGAPSIPTEEWGAAAALCERATLIAGLPEPFVNPCGDGTIHIRWFLKDGTRFLIEMRGAEFWWSVHGKASSADGVLGLLRLHAAR